MDLSLKTMAHANQLLVTRWSLWLQTSHHLLEKEELQLLSGKQKFSQKLPADFGLGLPDQNQVV
jgi:hypothetical protein